MYDIFQSGADLLTRIFQTYLTTRELPADWKVAIVTQVFKKGYCTKTKNYLPINLTSVVVKVLECIVNYSLLKHLTTNKESYTIITNLID